MGASGDRLQRRAGLDSRRSGADPGFTEGVKYPALGLSFLMGIKRLTPCTVVVSSSTLRGWSRWACRSAEKRPLWPCSGCQSARGGCQKPCKAPSSGPAQHRPQTCGSVCNHCHPEEATEEVMGFGPEPSSATRRCVPGLLGIMGLSKSQFSCETGVLAPSLRRGWTNEGSSM